MWPGDMTAVLLDCNKFKVLMEEWGGPVASACLGRSLRQMQLKHVPAAVTAGDHRGSHDQCQIAAVHAVPTCGTSGLRCCGPDDEEFADLGDCRRFDSECDHGVCLTCGFEGYRCCNGDSCGGYNFCDADAGGICSSLCGSAGLRCCEGASCAYDYACDADSYTCAARTCGRPGGTCCTPGERFRRCDYGSECLGGTCDRCGFDGDPCCPSTRDRFITDECFGDGAECGADGICSDAIPVQESSCGLRGDVCCPGGICVQGMLCTDGRCVDCGRRGQQCCADEQCEFGAACITRTGICGEITCGRLDFPCCDLSEEPYACSAYTDCGDSGCEPCGFDGQRCCSENSDPCFAPGECLANNTCPIFDPASPMPPPVTPVPPLPPPDTPRSRLPPPISAPPPPPTRPPPFNVTVGGGPVFRKSTRNAPRTRRERVAADKARRGPLFEPMEGKSAVNPATPAQTPPARPSKASPATSAGTPESAELPTESRPRKRGFNVSTE